MKKQLIYIILCISFLLAGPVVAGMAKPSHVFYVSMTTIRYLEAEQRFDLAVKIFSDNLEEAIIDQGAPSGMGILAGNFHPNAQDHVLAYLKKVLEVSVDGKPLEFTFKKMFNEVDASWCLLSARVEGKFDRLYIRNEILLDHYESQTNIVSIEVKGEKKFFNLDAQVRTEEVAF